jgi:hypothetical protein
MRLQAIAEMITALLEEIFGAEVVSVEVTEEEVTVRATIMRSPRQGMESCPLSDRIEGR